MASSSLFKYRFTCSCIRIPADVIVSLLKPLPKGNFRNMLSSLIYYQTVYDREMAKLDGQASIYKSKNKHCGIWLM